MENYFSEIDNYIYGTAGFISYSVFCVHLAFKKESFDVSEKNVKLTLNHELMHYWQLCSTSYGIFCHITELKRFWDYYYIFRGDNKYSLPLKDHLPNDKDQWNRFLGLEQEKAIIDNLVRSYTGDKNYTMHSERSFGLYEVIGGDVPSIVRYHHPTDMYYSTPIGARVVMEGVAKTIKDFFRYNNKHIFNDNELDLWPLSPNDSSDNSYLIHLYTLSRSYLWHKLDTITKDDEIKANTLLALSDLALFTPSARRFKSEACGGLKV